MLKSEGMKPFKLISIVLSTYFLLYGMSCTSLEEEPKSFTSPVNFYKTTAQIESGFAAAMDQLWGYWSGYGYAVSTFAHDDQLEGGNLVIGANHGRGLWNAHYRAILNLNNVIRALNEGNPEGASAEEVQLLEGQAKFLRGYNYFQLVRMFGGLPLITEEIEDPISVEITRASVEETYGLIIMDFQEAINKLPESWPESQRGRPTRDAARALLAKAYLTMATHPLNAPQYFADAARLADEVIKGGRHDLVEDVNQVFSKGTKYGPEMIWSFNSNYEDISTDPQIWAPEIIDGWGDYGVSPTWEQQYPDHPRKHAYLMVEHEGVHYTQWPGSQTAGVKKFLYDNPEDFESYRSVINFPIIRFADVLLIYAEAQNQANGGPDQSAVHAINRVIDRANGNVENPNHPRLTQALTIEEFDEAVIEERNYELCFEYDRWFDLVRKRILGEKNTEWIDNFSESDYLFPIPENDIRLNPLVVQNPGY